MSLINLLLPLFFASIAALILGILSTRLDAVIVANRKIQKLKTWQLIFVGVILFFIFSLAAIWGQIQEQLTEDAPPNPSHNSQLKIVSISPRPDIPLTVSQLDKGVQFVALVDYSFIASQIPNGTQPVIYLNIFFEYPSDEQPLSYVIERKPIEDYLVGTTRTGISTTLQSKHIYKNKIIVRLTLEFNRSDNGTEVGEFIDEGAYTVEYNVIN